MRCSDKKSSGAGLYCCNRSIIFFVPTPDEDKVFIRENSSGSSRLLTMSTQICEPKSNLFLLLAALSSTPLGDKRLKNLRHPWTKASRGGSNEKLKEMRMRED